MPSEPSEPTEVRPGALAEDAGTPDAVEASIEDARCPRLLVVAGVVVLEEGDAEEDR